MRFAVFLGAAAAAAGVISGCQQPVPPAPQPPEVTVARPVRKTVTDYDYFTGRMESVNTVEIRARVNGTRLLLDVQDDGPGTTQPAEQLLSLGTGLSTTAERLQTLYGDDHSLEIRSENGLAVSISLPLRRAS